MGWCGLLLGGIGLEGRSPADCPGEGRLVCVRVCACVCVCVLQYAAAAQLCGQMRPLTLASEAKVAQRWVLQSRGSDNHPPKEESRVLPGEAVEKADSRPPGRGVGSRDLLLGDWQQQLEWGTRAAGTLGRTGT